MAKKYRETEYISLRNDLLFHMVFTRNGSALKALLGALLNLRMQDILGIEILNPMQYSDRIDSKLTVLDIKVHLNGDRFVIVEMQVRRFGHWTNRTLAYACRQVADQVRKENGFNYGSLEPVILVSIMDHTLFPEHPRFFARYVPRDEEGHTYTEMLQFYVMDLTRMGAATAEDAERGLVEWARAFRADSWEKVRGIPNPGIKEAVKTMELIMANPTERDLIRARLDAELDHRTLMHEAEDRGEKRGKKIGEKRGKRIGERIGEKRGKKIGKRLGEKTGKAKAQKQFVVNMKSEGLPDDMISRITGLSSKEISEL
jgi:predicted transposase/invertase (TIGR01784 family)